MVLRSLLSMLLMLKLDFLRLASISSASSSLEISSLSSFLPLKDTSVASRSVLKRTSMLKYLCGTKACISRSLSTMIFSAALCTRPALSPLWIFWLRSGLSL